MRSWFLTPLFLAAACAEPKTVEYVWPNDVELAFLILQSPSSEIPDIRGPFLPKQAPVEINAETEDVLVVAVDTAQLATRYARFSPDSAKDVRLEARPSELEACVDRGLRNPSGTRVIAELGPEVSFHSLSGLDSTADEARFRASLSLSLPLSARCQPPRLVARSFSPDDRWVDGDPIFSGRRVLRSTPSALAIVDEDQVLIGSTWGIVHVERGVRADDDGTHAHGVDHPNSTPELPHGVRALALGATRPSGGRRVFAASSGSTDGNAQDGTVTEYVLDASGVRLERVLTAVSPEPMNVVLTLPDGSIVAGGDEVAAVFTETSSVTWKSTMRFRSVIASDNPSTPHAMGAADGDVWVGDVANGPGAMRPLNLGASTSNVVAFARLSDRVLILQREGLWYAHAFDPWEPVRIALDFPPEIVDCEGASKDECGRAAVSSTFSALAATDETAWIGSAVCGALLQVRLSDGCVDFLPLLPDSRQTPLPVLNGRQLLVAAHPGHLFEFEVQ